MSFFASFLKNNYRVIFGAFVLLVMFYALSLVFTTADSAPDGDLARWLRAISSPRG